MTMIFLYCVSAIVLSGCKHFDETRVVPPRNENQIARAWIHTKNPQIRRDLDEMKGIPESRSFLVHLSNRTVTDSELITHLRSHFENALKNIGDISDKVTLNGDCPSLYNEMVEASKLQANEMRSTVYSLKAEGLKDLQLLSIKVRAPVPRSENFILFESLHLLIPANVDKNRLINEKKDMIRNVLQNLQDASPQDVLRRLSILGYTAAMMQNVAVHVLASYNKKMKIAASKASECLVILGNQSGDPRRYFGIKADPVFPSGS